MKLVAEHDYYVVELFYWPDVEVLDWCVAQFGTESERWVFKFPNFYFADAKDHLMFTLRWA